MVHIRYLMGRTLNADCKETFGGELQASVNDLAICYKKTRTKNELRRFIQLCIFPPLNKINCNTMPGNQNLCPAGVQSFFSSL